jgi:hypothetical protein
MESHKENLFNMFNLFYLGIFFLVILAFSYVQAGAPSIRETCNDNEGRLVRTVYDYNLKVFAEARLLPRKEPTTAIREGISPYVIYINPQRYYLGRYTQTWLYLRQCSHIKEQHPVVQEGNRGLNVRDEQKADCLAIQAMISDPSISISSRQISSIERDMERLIRENRWSEVLSGPQRRIFLEKCLHER